MTANPAPAARKGGKVQPAVVVHVSSVWRAGEWRNFAPGEWVGMSAGHEPGNVVVAAGSCRNI